MMQYKWHTIYTKSRNEKKVLKELEERGIEAYLPLLKKKKRWSDRVKIVEETVLSGYMFVYLPIAKEDRIPSSKIHMDILNLNGVVCFITSQNKMIYIRDKDIESIKIMLSNMEVDVTTEKYHIGDKVEVIEGPFKGAVANLVEIKGKKHLAIEIETFNRTILSNVEVDVCSVIKYIEEKEPQLI